MSRWAVFAAMAASLILVGGSLIGQSNKADDKKEPTPRIKGTLPPNWKKLGLDDSQVQKIYKIQADYRTKIDALQAKIKALKQEQVVEQEKVLTAAQKARLKELRGGKPDSGANDSSKIGNSNSKDKK